MPRSWSPPMAAPATPPPTCPSSSTRRHCWSSKSARHPPAVSSPSFSPTSSPSSPCARSARTWTSKGGYDGTCSHHPTQGHCDGRRLDRRAADLLPDPLYDHHLVQVGAGGHPGLCPDPVGDVRELYRGPGAERLLQVLLQLGAALGRLDHPGPEIGRAHV